MVSRKKRPHTSKSKGSVLEQISQMADRTVTKEMKHPRLRSLKVVRTAGMAK